MTATPCPNAAQRSLNLRKRPAPSSREPPDVGRFQTTATQPQRSQLPSYRSPPGGAVPANWGTKGVQGQKMIDYQTLNYPDAIL